MYSEIRFKQTRSENPKTKEKGLPRRDGAGTMYVKKQLFLGPYHIHDEQIRIIHIQVCQSTDLNEYCPAVGLNVL